MTVLTSRANEELSLWEPIPAPETREDFDLDENVTAALVRLGCKVESAKRYGHSRMTWGFNAKIDCRTLDGKAVTYFHKAVEHERSAVVIEAEFESLKALNEVSALLAPRPYAWGAFLRNPACHFLLTEFRRVGEQPPKPGIFAKRIAELHKNSVSPTGMFGFHVQTTAGPILQQNYRWSHSWEETFTNMLGHLLDLDGKENKPWAELEHIKYLIKLRVIPRLLRPLQSEGRNIKPCLVHGDLWDGNAATDPVFGEPFIFDPQSFYAHNEYEIGDWRLRRHRLSAPEYAAEYIKHFDVSEPKEDWGSRNILYSLTYNTTAAVLHPELDQRVAIYEDMKKLCVMYCRQELVSRLKGDTVPKQLESPAISDTTVYSEEGNSEGSSVS